MATFMEKLTSGVNSISNTVKNTGDTARINNEMSQNKRECEKLYMQLGFMLKEAHPDGFGIPEADELCAKINEIMAKNKELEKALQAVKDRRYCVKCSTELAPDSVFCHECGTRNDLPGEAVNNTSQSQQAQPVRRVVAVKSVVSPASEPAAPPPTEKRCPACGKIESIDSLFCSECGAKL